MAGMNFSIKISGDKPVRMLFERGGEREKALEAIEAGVKKGGQRIIDNVKRNAPLRTGHLRASYGQFTPELIRSRYSADQEHPANYDRPINELRTGSNYIRYKFGSQVPYCVIQEFWKPPHKIGRSPYQWAAIMEEAKSLMDDIAQAYIRWVQRGERVKITR